MARPDLSTPEGKARYRAELMAIGRPWRILGLLMVAAALAGILIVRMQGEALLGTGLGILSVALMVLGWALLFFVIAKRTRHHRQRMLG
jgi:hypothetical protein